MYQWQTMVDDLLNMEKSKKSPGENMSEEKKQID